MAKPRLLWVDCTSGLPDAEPRVWSASVFEVLWIQGVAAAARELAKGRYHAACFEFDYPDQSCLQAMQDIKQSYPRMPMLMLTLEHSESLAIWAFRARMWNYFVKPVEQAELLASLRTLANLGQRSSPPRVAQLAHVEMPRDLPIQPIPPEVARLQPALRYVAANYHQRLSAHAVAKACGLSRFEFSRRFRNTFKTTFREYLLRVRIAEARRFLAEGRVSITGIAYSVGFNDGSHFARMFRRYTGMLPSEFATRQPAAALAQQAVNGADAGLRRRSSDATIAFAG
jgi:AraC-like DNA-binding protein/ActR/RegA family two-component response regulator